MASGGTVTQRRNGEKERQAAEQIDTLVVDDDESICLFLKEALEDADYRVTTVSDSRDALDLLRIERFGLILLDLNLGSYVDGQRILETVKWRWPETVVVILTAYGSLESAIDAIHEGVDDYLLKPVEPEQIIRTVGSALWRKHVQANDAEEDPQVRVLEYRPLSLNLELQQVTVDGELVHLVPIEYRLLAHLMQNAHKPVSSEELARVARQCECTDRQKAQELIMWYVRRLRRKVEFRPSRPRHIVNVRGFGYMFVP
jgi:DNA-binding response OmpR family regulator